MKESLDKLFQDLNFSPKFFNNFYEPNELSEIKNLLFNYKYFINVASKNLVVEGHKINVIKEELLKSKENKRFLN